MHEKAKFICFIYMQLQKVKFKFVQINMKHLLYNRISKNEKFYFWKKNRPGVGSDFKSVPYDLGC